VLFEAFLQTFTKKNMELKLTVLANKVRTMTKKVQILKFKNRKSENFEIEYFVVTVKGK
jgi:hypothetical protein